MKHPPKTIDAAIVALRRIVGHDGVVDQSDVLSVYETDGFIMARGRPAAAVLPRDTAEVQACLAIVARHGLVLVPRGSGSGVAGGAIAFDGGVLITTNRMSRIESIDLANRMAVVQAGVRNDALSAAVAVHGWHFAPDPSSQSVSSIGGNTATNAGGVNTMRYGVMTNHVIGVEMVLPDGSVVRTRNGAALDGFGADLPALLCGSEGTLGIITRVWCRLAPLPGAFRTISAVYGSIEEACETVSDIIASNVATTCMEVIDRTMLEALRSVFKIAFPVNADAVLVAEINGIDASLDEELADLLALCHRHHVLAVRHCDSEAQRASLWEARRKAAGAIGRISPSYCVQDACIPRTKLAEAMRHIMKMGRDAGVRVANVFHAGDGNIHPTMLFDHTDPQQVQRVVTLSHDLLSYCVSIGGTITGEHGVGVEKIGLMPVMFNPPTMETFHRVRRTFDPEQRMNRSKLLPHDRVRVTLADIPGLNVPAGL